MERLGSIGYPREAIFEVAQNITETRIESYKIIEALSGENLSYSLKIISQFLVSLLLKYGDINYSMRLASYEVLDILMLGTSSVYFSNRSVVKNILRLGFIQEYTEDDSLLALRIVFLLSLIKIEKEELVSLLIENSYREESIRIIIDELKNEGLIINDRTTDLLRANKRGKFYISLISDATYIKNVLQDTFIESNIYETIFKPKSLRARINNFLEYLEAIEKRKPLSSSTLEYELALKETSKIIGESKKKIYEQLSEDTYSYEGELFIHIKDKRVNPGVLAEILGSLTVISDCPPGLLNVTYLEAGSFKGILKAPYELLKGLPEKIGRINKLIKKVYLIEEEKDKMKAEAEKIRAEADKIRAERDKTLAEATFVSSQKNHEDVKTLQTLLSAIEKLDEAEISFENRILIRKVKGQRPMIFQSKLLPQERSPQFPDTFRD